MIISGIEIKNKLGKEIIIDPFDEKQLNPNSYNLKLYDELMTYDEAILDMKKKNATSRMTIPQSGLLLQPNKLYLGRTMEYTKTHNYIPMLEGRSSIGRLGMFVHVTAGFGDIGFEGYWTLEISVITPIVIYPHIDICQIYFHTIKGDYLLYEGGKYQKNNDIQPSYLYKDFIDESRKTDKEL